MLDDHPDLVHAKYRGAATTMLEVIAQPDVFGKRLGVQLGVERRIVQLLIEHVQTWRMSAGRRRRRRGMIRKMC
jgi:hypothetical protein